MTPQQHAAREPLTQPPRAPTLRSAAAATECLRELEPLYERAQAHEIEELFEAVCERLASVLPVAHASLSTGTGAATRVMARWPSELLYTPPVTEADVTIVMRRARGLEVTLHLYLVDCDPSWDADFAAKVSVPISNVFAFAHRAGSTYPPPPRRG